MILAARQENDRAIEVFNQAVKLRPEHSWGYIGLGLALNNKQDFRGALPHLEKAVGVEPNSINAQYQLGFALFSLGETERAAACFARVVELDPRFNPMAYKYLSSIRIKKGDAAGAADALESYLKNFPDAPDRDRVKQILSKLGR
jgi:tetratricopeptide (TPR) repeat protein